MPGYLLAIARVDRIGHWRLQLLGFAMMAAYFAITTPASSAGGPDHGGSSGTPPGAGSSPVGKGSKNMTSRYAVRQQAEAMWLSALE